jgi:hypothetical protein
MSLKKFCCFPVILPLRFPLQWTICCNSKVWPSTLLIFLRAVGSFKLIQTLTIIPINNNINLYLISRLTSYWIRSSSLAASCLHSHRILYRHRLLSCLAPFMWITSTKTASFASNFLSILGVTKNGMAGSNPKKGGVSSVCRLDVITSDRTAVLN